MRYGTYLLASAAFIGCMFVALYVATREDSLKMPRVLRWIVDQITDEIRALRPRGRHERHGRRLPTTPVRKAAPAPASAVLAPDEVEGYLKSLANLSGDETVLLEPDLADEATADDLYRKILQERETARAARLAELEGPAPAEVPENTGQGATEDWSPTAEGIGDRGTPVAQATWDSEEMAIFAAFDRIQDDMRQVPDYLADWMDAVDHHLVSAGVDTADHHKARWGAFEITTGAYPLVAVS